MPLKVSGAQPFRSRPGSNRNGNVLALVLAGGRGSRLKGLTDWRAKPAVPFGGNYRLIDFALSNCINSGINNIGVITQYKSHSLNKHIQKGWQLFNVDGSHSLELLPAQQRTQDRCWYSGTADAIYQNLDIIKEHRPSHVIILAGDHIYKMNYGEMVRSHIASGAKLTICTTEIDKGDAYQFGVLKVDDNNVVTDFVEKPLELAEGWDANGKVNISTGIYVFDAEFLYDQVSIDHNSKKTENDFGKDLIPGLIGDQCVSAYQFCADATNCSGYWRDVGTIDSYYSANMELLGVVPSFNLYDQNWPIRASNLQLPPAKIVVDTSGISGSVSNSLIGSGCIVCGATVENSLLSTNVVVNSGSTLIDSVVLPDVLIGENCYLRKVIIDKACDLPDGIIVGYDSEWDEAHFTVSDEGVVLVTREGLNTVQSFCAQAA